MARRKDALVRRALEVAARGRSARRRRKLCSMASLPRILGLSCCVLLFACGGSEASGPGGDASTDTSSDAISDAPTTTPCPPVQPANGSTCPSLAVGVTCEYGVDPRPNCNTHFECTTSGWQNLGGTGCPPLVPPGATCPATMGAAEALATCSPEGVICVYGNRTCVCSSCDGPCSTTPTFHCDAPPTDPSCPDARPDVGQPCSASDGATCVYGTCAGGTLVGRKCSGGMWTDVPMECPA